MLDIQPLYDDWTELASAKPDFLFGNDELLMDDFKDLVKSTYEVIREVHEALYEENYDVLDPDTMRDYFNLISMISTYASPCFINETNENTFVTSRLIAQSLADYAANYSIYKEDEGEGFEENVLTSFDGFDYGVERELSYDVNLRNTEDFEALANAIGF